MTQERRQLKFHSLDEAARDAEALLAQGYSKLGNWSLGQCCGHLAAWLRFPLVGFPTVPLLLRPLLMVMRQTLGKKYRQKWLAGDETMPVGIRTIAETVPEPTKQDAEAVAEFRQAVEAWQAHQGPIHPSPLLGPLTRDEAYKIQLIHCAHHLSFLVPQTTPASDRPA